MTESTNETPLLDLLARMTADSIAASSLDTETLMLVRIVHLPRSMPRRSRIC
jgi:hypothetical protein